MSNEVFLLFHSSALYFRFSIKSQIFQMFFLLLCLDQVHFYTSVKDETVKLVSPTCSLINMTLTWR